MTWIFAVVIALSVAIDCLFTQKLLQVRPQDELNPMIRWIHKKAGILPALVAGLIVPNAAVLVLLLDFPQLLAFFAGTKAMFAGMQLYKKSA